MLIQFGSCGVTRQARYDAPDGPPPVGSVIDEGGQFYYTVREVKWIFTNTFFRRRLEALVIVDEHDRAEEDWERMTDAHASA